MEKVKQKPIIALALVAQAFSLFFCILLETSTLPMIFSILTILSLSEELQGKFTNQASVEELKQQAVTDPLTTLMNRRGGEAAIEKYIFRAQCAEFPISVLMLDIDHFKDFNDKFGHLVGDIVIKEVALKLKEHLRASDIAIRWGGEEYLVCLPDTHLKGAIEKAEKLREQINSLEVQGTKISVSIGCAELGDDDFQVMLARADLNLYLSKTKGRNQVFPDFNQIMLDRTPVVD